MKIKYQIDKNKSLIMRFIKKNRNELVKSYDGSIKRLIGFTDIPEDDYYYVLEALGGAYACASCVGGLKVIKGTIEDELYDLLIDAFNIMHNPTESHKRWLKEKNLE